MNAKICKKARQLARKLSIGMPDRQLLGKVHKVTRIEKGKKVEYEQQQAVNNPRTTRGIYRILKRAIRAGRSLADLQPQHKPSDDERALLAEA
jgi:hypothetical protein